MRFSNDGSNWSAWELYTGSKTWTLSPGEGSKTVYVQFKDNAGNISQSYIDDIVVDATPPTGSIVINGGANYTNNILVNLTLSASDSGSGVSQMRFSNDGITWSDWEPYTTTKSWSLTPGDGNKTIYVQYRDNSGSISEAYISNILLDTTWPTDGSLYAIAGDQQASLRWTGFADTTSGIFSYGLVYSAMGIPGSCAGGTQIYSGSGISFLHTGLTNGTTYYYRVCATDHTGNTSVGPTASTTPSVPATVPLVLYDDFSEPSIEKNKWGQWEYVREIQDGKLVLKTTAYGKRVGNGLEFSNPAPIQYIETDVVIESIEGDLGSTGISNYASPRTQLTGFFYNDGSASGPGSFKGEVQGAIQILPYNNTLWVFWNFGKSTNDEGTNWTTLGGGYFPEPVSLNTTYKLSIQFDPGSKRFTFKVGATTITRTSTDTIYPSNRPWKVIGTAVPFIGTDIRGLYGRISATFDNIIAKDASGNVVVSDDFSLGEIDEAKWKTYEFGREISDGKFRSKVRSSSAYNSLVSSILDFINPNPINNISVKVTPLAYQNEEGVSTLARITGRFYNDGTPGGGYIGDVGAHIAIGGWDSTPKAEWCVYRYTDVGGSLSLAEVLAEGEFFTPITLGNNYTLFLGWNGSKFTFKIDNEEAQYTPTTMINPPNNPGKAVGAGIFFNDSGQEATIEALFDDVMVDGYIFPFEGTMGTEVSIGGSGFGSKKGKIFIGGVALKVLEWRDDVIRCSLAKVLNPGIYDLVIQPVEPKGAPPIIYEEAFVARPAEIHSIEQGEGTAYDQVTIKGKYFGTKKGAVYLEYGEGEDLIRKSCKVSSWTMDPTTGDSEIVFVVPKMLPEVCDVVVDPYGALPETEDEDGFTVKPPEINSVEPGSGSVGEEITLLGNYFGPKKGKVYLGYLSNGKPTKKSCSILSWGDDEIVFTVPKLPVGIYDVIVTNNVGLDTRVGGFVIK
jgi:hypothetical protein